MSTPFEQIAEQIKALADHEREEFFAWLYDFQSKRDHEWDKEIARDSRLDGRLASMLSRVRRDLAEARTKPLDEVINNP